MRGARGEWWVVVGSRGRTAKIFREKEGDNKRNDDKRGPKGTENEEMGSSLPLAQLCPTTLREVKSPN